MVKPFAVTEVAFTISTHNFYLDKNFHVSGSDSIQLLGGCYGTRYGCCDDGLTSALGPKRDGCPEQEVVTMPLTTPILITTTPYVSVVLDF